MAETVTVRLQERTKNSLDKLKQYPRETYDDIIVRLLKVTKEVPA